MGIPSEEHRVWVGRITRQDRSTKVGRTQSQQAGSPYSLREPTEEWYRRDRISRAIQSGQRPDPEDLAEEEAERVRYQRRVAEAFEQKRKQLESEFSRRTEQHPQVPNIGARDETLDYMLREGLRQNVAEAERLIGLSKRTTRTKPPAKPRSQKRQINIWAEIKKHKGWYLVAFLLSGWPLGIATIWPTLTDKKVPEWLAEHGWPRLTTLVMAWVAVVAIIAIVIVARSAQTALRNKGV